MSRLASRITGRNSSCSLTERLNTVWKTFVLENNRNRMMLLKWLILSPTLSHDMPVICDHVLKFTEENRSVIDRIAITCFYCSWPPHDDRAIDKISWEVTCKSIVICVSAEDGEKEEWWRASSKMSFAEELSNKKICEDKLIFVSLKIQLSLSSIIN